MDQAKGTTFDQHEPSLLISKQPLPLKYLQSAGASNGDVITYNSTSGEGEWASAGGGNVLTDAHIFVGDGGNLAQDVAVSGDLTLANSGAFTIANNAVNTAKIANNSVTGAKIALAGQVTGDIMYYDGTDWVVLPIGTAGQVLTVSGGGLPSWA